MPAHMVLILPWPPRPSSPIPASPCRSKLQLQSSSCSPAVKAVATVLFAPASTAASKLPMFDNTQGSHGSLMAEWRHRATRDARPRDAYVTCMALGCSWCHRLPNAGALESASHSCKVSPLTHTRRGGPAASASPGLRPSGGAVGIRRAAALRARWRLNVIRVREQVALVVLGFHLGKAVQVALPAIALHPFHTVLVRPAIIAWVGRRRWAVSARRRASS